MGTPHNAVLALPGVSEGRPIEYSSTRVAEQSHSRAGPSRRGRDVGGALQTDFEAEGALSSALGAAGAPAGFGVIDGCPTTG